MNWLVMFLLSIVVPVVQPRVEQGVQKLQARLQQAKPATTAQEQIVFHDGRWWKWDGRQWWVWAPQQQGGLYVSR